MSSSISPINVSSLFSTGGVRNQSTGGGDSDGDNDKVGRTRQGGGGPLAGALLQTFGQLGIGGTTGTQPGGTTTASNTSGSTQDNALRTFMRDLFQALQNQPANGKPPTTQAQGTNNGTDTGGTGKAGQTGFQGGGRLNRLQQDLQSLVNNLSAQSTGSTTGGNSDTLSNLQNDFSTLVSSLGGQGSGVTLTSFLQTLQQNLTNTPREGRLVKTSV